VTEPPKPPNRPADEPRQPRSTVAPAQRPGPAARKDGPRRSAPIANSDRDRYWPRDGPIRWGALFGGALKQATLIVAVLVHLVLGVVLVADLGFGPPPSSADAEVVGWLLALAYAVLTVIVVRGWLFFSWWVAAGPVTMLVLLAWAGRPPFD
jgi:hypothetical protein